MELTTTQYFKSIFFILLFTFILFNENANSQNYPGYSVTAHDQNSNGYFFITPIRIGANPGGILPTQMILDNNGKVVYYKPILNGSNTGDFKIQDNGWISYSYSGKYFFIDSTFTVVDSVVTINGIAYDGHDVQILPNGHFLLLGTESIQMDLSAYHFFGPNHTLAGSATANVICGVIQELDANKNLVFEWHAVNYFSIQDIDVDFMSSPILVDWTHFNAIDLDDDGNILVSSRHLSEITKINHIDGSVMWRMGGHANQFNFVNDSLMFKGQHDIRKIANGHYTLFDDGDENSIFPQHPATGKEYEIDTINMTVTLVWSYVNDSSAYSLAMGSFGREPGGISTVGYGWYFNNNSTFTAVNDAGTKMLEVVFDDTLRSYRTFHYDTLPWNLNRPQLSCYLNSGQYYIDAGPGHASYQWTNGATTQSIPINAIDTFQVFVPKGDGGYISSEEFVVTNLLNPCGTLSLNENTEISFSLYPNPVTNLLVVQFQNTQTITENVELRDVTGKLISSFKAPQTNKLEVNTTNLANGIYLICMQGHVKRFVKM